MTRPKPIADPQQGHYQAVASFRVNPDPAFHSPHAVAADLRRELALWAEEYNLTSALSVTVYVVGAQGERSEDEGRYDHPSVLANLDDIEHVRATHEIDPGGRL